MSPHESAEWRGRPHRQHFEHLLDRSNVTFLMSHHPSPSRLSVARDHRDALELAGRLQEEYRGLIDEEVTSAFAPEDLDRLLKEAKGRAGGPSFQAETKRWRDTGGEDTNPLRIVPISEAARIPELMVTHTWSQGLFHGNQRSDVSCETSRSMMLAGPGRARMSCSTARGLRRGIHTTTGAWRVREDGRGQVPDGFGGGTPRGRSRREHDRKDDDRYPAVLPVVRGDQRSRARSGGRADRVPGPSGVPGLAAAEGHDARNRPEEVRLDQEGDHALDPKLALDPDWPKLPTEQRNSPSGFSRNERHAILRAAEQLSVRDEAIIKLLMYTGPRASSLAAARLSNVVINARGGEITYDVVKGNREYSVPLNAEARRALAAWTEERPPVEHDHLFCSERSPYEPIGRHTVYHVWHERMRALLPKEMRARIEGPHQARHDLARRLLSGDEGSHSPIPAADAAAILGHADPRITVSVYSRPVRRASGGSSIDSWGTRSEGSRGSRGPGPVGTTGPGISARCDQSAFRLTSSSLRCM